MNFKTTFVLLIALIVVGVMFFFNMNRQTTAVPDSEQPTAAGQGPKLIDLASDQVSGITITDADGNRTAVSRQGAAWHMTEPVSAGAVDWQTQDLIRTICDLRSQGRPDTTPADAGLDKPKFKVDLITTDGKTDRLTIGDKTEIGDNMYAQVNGGDVNLIDSSLGKNLKTAASDLRDKHLLTTTSTDFKQITLETPTQTIQIVKNGDKWTITKPVKMPGDADTISSLISTITGTEATEFVDPNSDELAFARFDHPTMKITLDSEAPSTQPSTMPSTELTLTIGSPDSLSKDHYFVESSDGLVGKIDKSSLDNLTKTPLDLRDREVLAVAPAEVSKISLVKAIFPPSSTTEPAPAVQRPTFTQLVVLTRRAPKIEPIGPKKRAAATVPATQPQSVWMFAIPSEPNKQVDDSKVDALLEKFNPVRADKYLDKAPDTRVEQKYVVTLESPSLKKYHIEIVRPSGGGTPYAAYDGLTFEIPSSDLDALDADFHKAP